MPLSPEQIADGWIEHDGGDQPLNDWSSVGVQFRDGRSWDTNCLVGNLFWHHDGRGDDIIAYRPENRHD